MVMVEVAVAVNVDVGVAEGVNATTVCVAALGVLEGVSVTVGDGVRVGVRVGVFVGTAVAFLGFLVLVGFLVGTSRLLDEVTESPPACTGIASRHTKRKPKKIIKPVLNFIMGRL